MVLLSQCGDKSSTASASDMGMVQDYRPRSSTPSGNQTYVVKSPTKLGKTRIHMYTWYMIICGGFFQQTMFDWWGKWHSQIHPKTISGRFWPHFFGHKDSPGSQSFSGWSMPFHATICCFSIGSRNYMLCCMHILTARSLILQADLELERWTKTPKQKHPKAWYLGSIQFEVYT